MKVFFFLAHFSSPQGIPLRVRESEFRPDLPEVLNKNLTLDLPGPLTVQDVGRLVVWCPEYGVSFGRVDLTEKPEKVPNLELEHVGPFIKTEHAVKGTVFIQDDETLVIHDFNYDGQVRNIFLKLQTQPLPLFGTFDSISLNLPSLAGSICGVLWWRGGKSRDWQVYSVPVQALCGSLRPDQIEEDEEPGHHPEAAQGPECSSAQMAFSMV